MSTKVSCLSAHRRSHMPNRVGGTPLPLPSPHTPSQVGVERVGAGVPLFVSRSGSGRDTEPSWYPPTGSHYQGRLRLEDAPSKGTSTLEVPLENLRHFRQAKVPGGTRIYTHTHPVSQPSRNFFALSSPVVSLPE